MLTIADVKRNDIESSAKAYSNAFLGRNDIGLKRFFKNDFITVNGYFGTDGIKPFVEDCAERNRGIFVLVKTSNPSSDEFQNLTLEDGRKVYEAMADLVSEWGKPLIGKYGYSSVKARLWAPRTKKKARSLGQKCVILSFSYPVTAFKAAMRI